MNFNITSFSDELYKLLKEMVNEKYSPSIAKSLQQNIGQFKKNKDDFINDPNHPEALKTIISLIITKSWWRDSFLKTKNFDKHFDDFLLQYPDFRTSGAETALIALADRISPFKDTFPKIRKLLGHLQSKSLKDWSNDLYTSLDTSILGPKGRDNYLRDNGWWDRVPMDRHLMRFIMRTGIYHTYSEKGLFDQQRQDEIQNTFARFCIHCLKGKKIQGIDLEKSPGILDIFIWRFCKVNKKNDPGMNICGSKPKCTNCPLKTVCLFALL